jgi:nucleoside-diphosphate-sugar epimerase
MAMINEQQKEVEAVEYLGVKNLVSTAAHFGHIRRFVLASSAFVMRPSDLSHLWRNYVYANVLKWKLKVSLSCDCLIFSSQSINQSIN